MKTGSIAFSAGGTIAVLVHGATLVLDGMTFQISYTGGTGDDVVLTRTA